MRLAAALPRTPTASRTPPWPAPPRSAGVGPVQRHRPRQPPAESADAALVNGMLIHGLDFDDTTPGQHYPSPQPPACPPRSPSARSWMSTAVSIWWPTRGDGNRDPCRSPARAKGELSHPPPGFPPCPRRPLPLSAPSVVAARLLNLRPRPSSRHKASPPAPLPGSRSSWRKALDQAPCTPAGPPLPHHRRPPGPARFSRPPPAPMRASSASSIPTSPADPRPVPIDCRPKLATLGSVWSSPRPPSNPTGSATSPTAARCGLS